MKILIGLAVLTFVTCQTHAPDHLLMLLKAMHASQTFHALPTAEKVIATELLAAAEVDQVTHYIDQLGFARLLLFLDHVNKINATEAHMLEKYLEQELNQEIRPQPAIVKREEDKITKRDLQSILKTLQANPAYQNLTQADKDLMQELISTAEAGRLTPVIYREGYSKIIALVEHLGNPTLTHRFLTYLIKHMNEEAMHQTTVNPLPVG